MTPEEAAVINAAIAMTRIGHEPTVPEMNILRDATWKLVTACEDCNHDTHRCPGCGAWVPHASSGVCRECETTYADECRCAADEKMYCASSQCHGGSNLPPEMQWVTRTWQDVRTNDVVRMPGTDVTATIEHRYRHPSQDQAGKDWHVISGGDGRFAHMKDHIVQPGECVVLLAGESQPRWMNPAAAVEIEMTAEGLCVTEQLRWENRL
jgi:hypothetical protein